MSLFIFQTENISTLVGCEPVRNWYAAQKKGVLPPLCQLSILLSTNSGSTIVSQSRLYSSLKYMSKTYAVGKCHPVVRPCLKNDRDIPRIPVQNKVLTGTYILQTNKVKFNQNEVNPVCQLCKEDETLQHFLINSKSLEDARQPILGDFVRILSDLLVKHPVSAE